MPGFLAELGLRVLANGYNVIPIKPGAKYPVIKGWQNTRTTREDIGYWLGNGHADAGIGITTGKVSFVDCDIPDEIDARAMEEFIILEVGFAPIRIGNFPKRGFMFRMAGKPIRKMSSRVYRDELGRRYQIEILGEGQQFVSHHIHPETGKPYLWQIGDGPECIPVDELPVITVEDCQRIIVEFERLMIARGYTAEGAVATTVREYGDDDLEELGVGSDPSGMSEEELARLVRSIPNDNTVPYGDDDSQTVLGWLKVMCAIHHETDGSESGHRLAYEWSTRAAKHKDDRFEKTWLSLGRGGGRKLTHRYIRKWAAIYGRQGLAGILKKLDAAIDVEALKATIVDAKKLVLDALDQERLSTGVQRNAKRLGVTLSAAKARSMVRSMGEGTPDWLKNWVYLTHTAEFYHQGTGERIGREAFDAAHGRYLAEGNASRYALDIAKIPVFHMTMYLPAEEATFTDGSGLKWVNTYSERNVPKVPDQLEEREQENVERVIRHFEFLFPIERERELAKSWFAHIVQTKQRPNWAILMQGVDGDGRTFFANMMAAVLGGNSRTINGSDIEDRFTGWAVGQLFTAIEEVKMIGHNRYDILNKMKPYITNTTIPIREMRTNVYNAQNTTAYMLTSNFQNALPITNADRRYFILQSQWQDEKHIKKVTEEGYFDRLQETLQSAGALRGWLLNYQLHPEFKPYGRAPESTGRQSMIEQARPDENMVLEDLIESGFYYDISENVVVVSKLAHILEVRTRSNFPIKETSCSAILRIANFTRMGRIIYEGKKVTVWSRNPRKFDQGISSPLIQIANYLKNPL